MSDTNQATRETNKLASILLALFISVWLPQAYGADGLTKTSAYTQLNLDECQQIQQQSYSYVWRCPGYGGIPVWVAEDDSRYLVSFGANAAEQPAAEQSLPPFTRLGNTLEWRLEMPQQHPFATILRWHTEHSGTPDGEILVVTRVSDDEACHVAYVDARANPSANVLARRAADRLASGFNCGSKPLVVGDRSEAAWYLDPSMGYVRPGPKAFSPADSEQRDSSASSSHQDAQNRASALLLGLRTGENYRSFLVYHDIDAQFGNSSGIHEIEGMIVSPQPEGLMRLQMLTVRLPEGCLDKNCRGISRTVFAAPWGQRLTPVNTRASIRQEMQSAMQGSSDGNYRRETVILSVAKSIVCGHTRARWESSAPHPTHIERRGCIPLTKGRLTFADGPLPPEHLLSEAELKQVRERIKERYASGQFENSLPSRAMEAVGQLKLSSMRLLLEHQNGTLQAFVIADAFAPYVLSETYDVQVKVPAGRVSQPPAQAEAAANTTAERDDANARLTFTSFDQALRVVLDTERLRLIDRSSGAVLQERKLAWDDLVSAAWISVTQSRRLKQQFLQAEDTSIATETEEALPKREVRH
ncbi:hypothetical protein GLV89_08330 [Halomonas alkaliantarctica]|nr:hypothetical protein [Halomonas alkaliantarctica]